MTKKIDKRLKKTYKEEYKLMYEALCNDLGPDEEISSCSFSDSTSSSSDDDEDRACNTRIVENDKSDEKIVGSTWSELPDLIVEKIFSYLTMKEKYYSSLVCKNWYAGFHTPNAWRIFIFDDTTLTRRIFNYYTGWQYMLDHLRAQLCLNSIGRHIRVLVFKPIYNFYNLYEFMNMISFYSEQKDNPHCSVKDIGTYITRFQYTFPCSMSTRNETRLYGTGGKLLDALKRLLMNLPSLQHLQLVDLMLDYEEASTLLDDVCHKYCSKIRTLILVNISKMRCELLHLGVFTNLQVLITSPQSLGSDVISLLSETNLRDLYIVQNSYTPIEVAPVPYNAWMMCKAKNPTLKIHLMANSHKQSIQLVWQEGAPVYSILFNSPHMKLDINTINNAVDFYSSTLTMFGHLSLPRYYESRSFSKRMDSLLVYLCDQCPRLETLIIRDKISTATILLIAKTAQNLKKFYVRRNSILLRCDWTKKPYWTEEFYKWLKTSSLSYETTEREVSKILGYTWTMLSDKEFLGINFDVENFKF